MLAGFGFNSDHLFFSFPTDLVFSALNDFQSTETIMQNVIWNTAGTRK
jgi:hypothetical protein